MENNIIKKWNSQLMLLWKIKELSPLSKKELQNATGVSWGLVSKVVNALEEKEFIVSNLRSNSKVGRNAEEYDINMNKYLSVGVEITCDSIISVVTDLKGRVIEKEYMPLESYDRECAICTINDSLDRIISHYNKDDLLGIGFSVQGIVDREKGISDHIHKIKGWDYVPLKSIYEERYGMNVGVEHNTDCLLKSEVDIGKIEKDTKDAILCNISHRFGTGVTLMINGETYHGATGKAGEIGSTPIGYENGQPIYINDIIRRKHLVTEYEKRINEKIEYSDFVEKIFKREEEALGVYQDFCDKMGTALATLCNVFNPAELVISVSGCEMEDILYKNIEKQIIATRFDNCMLIKKSNLPKEASAIGAALNMAEKAVSLILE